MSRAWEVATSSGVNKLKIGSVTYQFPAAPATPGGAAGTGGTKMLGTQSPAGNQVKLEWMQQGGLPAANQAGQLLVSGPAVKTGTAAKAGFEWKVETGLDAGVNGSDYPPGLQTPS